MVIQMISSIFQINFNQKTNISYKAPNNKFGYAFKYNKCSNDTFLKSSNKVILLTSPVSFGFRLDIKAFDELPCPCCRKTMRSEHTINNIADMISRSKGKKLITALNDVKDSLDKTEQNVIEEIINVASLQENKNLTEIINILLNSTDLSNRNGFTPLESLIIKQTKVLNSIRKLSDSFDNKSLKPKIQEELNLTENLINDKSSTNTFKRKSFINTLYSMEQSKNSNLTKKDRNIFDKIIARAKKLPSSTTDTDAFIVKYKNRDSFETAIALLKCSELSFDHVKPQSSGGKTICENLLPMRSSCNNTKDRIKLHELIITKPYLKDNLHIFFHSLLKRADERLVEYKNNIPDLIETIYSESKGLITINIDDHKLISDRTHSIESPIQNNLQTNGFDGELIDEQLQEKWNSQISDILEKLTYNSK